MSRKSIYFVTDTNCIFIIWLSLLLTMSFTAYYRQFREQRILGFQGAEPRLPKGSLFSQLID